MGPPYLRPLALDPETRGVLELTGTEVYGFEFRIAREDQATVSLIARDEKGLIGPLSREFTITGLAMPQTVRLVLIRPEKLGLGPANRFRVVCQVGPEEILNSWETGREPARIGAGMRQTGPVPIENPVLGKSYTAAVYEVHTQAMGAAQKSFLLELRFRVDRPAPPISLGSVRTSKGPYLEDAKQTTGKKFHVR